MKACNAFHITLAGHEIKAAMPLSFRLENHLGGISNALSHEAHAGWPLPSGRNRIEQLRDSPS